MLDVLTSHPLAAKTLIVQLIRTNGDRSWGGVLCCEFTDLGSRRVCTGDAVLHVVIARVRLLVIERSFWCRSRGFHATLTDETGRTWLPRFTLGDVASCAFFAARKILDVLRLVLHVRFDLSNPRWVFRE